MNENEIATKIVNCAYKIHKSIGPGLLESVYERFLVTELVAGNLKCERQVGVPVTYQGLTIDLGFRMDLLVHNLVIVELKSVELVLPVHKKQLLSYLKLANKKLGLLINFNELLIKNGITRIANNL